MLSPVESTIKKITVETDVDEYTYHNFYIDLSDDYLHIYSINNNKRGVPTEHLFKKIDGVLVREITTLPCYDIRLEIVKRVTVGDEVIYKLSK